MFYNFSRKLCYQLCDFFFFISFRCGQSTFLMSVLYVQTNRSPKVESSEYNIDAQWVVIGTSLLASTLTYDRVVLRVINRTKIPIFVENEREREKFTYRQLSLRFSASLSHEFEWRMQKKRKLKTKETVVSPAVAFNWYESPVQ